MSTSVYKPLGLSLTSRTSDRMIIGRPEIRKVKRVLFDFDPVDHAATQKFINEELEKITILQSERWNFDFQRERTLNPNGTYKWRPVTPQKTIRPIKIQISSEVDTQDLYAEPGEIIRPTPVRPIQEIEMKSPPKTTGKTERVQNENSKPQRLITDFMPVKKRSVPDFAKKMEWTPSSMERPSKLPRLTDFTS